MISIENVSKKYKNFTAINNLNLKISNSSIIGLIGPNGAGKTTTISMLIGLLDVSEGDIIINDISIKDRPIDVKKQIGYVSDDENQLLCLKAIEYLNFVSDMYKVSESERRKQILNLSERFNIQNNLDTRMDKFSKGMKQKIMVIASLIHSPKVWILDEPFTGLDPQTSYELKMFMKEYAAKGNTIILSSHILEIVENLCDKIILIDKGKTLYYGELIKLKAKFNTKYTLEEIYMEVFKNEGINISSKN
ncbi:MAG: ABC transporter ATP-binding protein [Clostridium beijerinckii]|jgi:ABC-2 type transport system ATP-binding protein|nr:ABC transporter ATP-binding protein [Clostridium beijerinckii]MCI1578279.1 ABC transporter ATP-binding protein [Clostridium beijerinckii]MCI1586194.1 ABC transporter ATP-binding protein [Clostridium beijerinckii]MCI1621478.1 ABC transporter ATP-binding protein [Clostridium beijerinckii]